MNAPIKFALGILALAFSIAFVEPELVRADDAVAKPATMPQVGMVVAKSIDSVTAFVKQIGLDVPPPLTAAELEKQFPFIGPGGLDTTRPIGIVVCAGPNLDTTQMMAFVFPMKPTGGTLDSLKALGGTVMPDHADTVLIGGVGVRRTADYLVFSPNPNVAPSVDTDIMLAAVKGPDVLAKLVVDFKVLRGVIPEQYKAMIASLQDSATKDAKTPLDKENSMMFITPVIKTIDTIDRMEMGIESGEKGVRIAISGTPLKVQPGAAGAVRPGMPPEVFVRFDTNFASSESTAGIRNQIQKAFNHGATEDGTLSADEKKELEDIGNQLGSLICDPATTSIGVATAGADPVLYAVQHWAKPTDVTAELEKLSKRINTLVGSGTDGIKSETYVEGGVTVTRFGHKSNHPSEFEVDIAQRDSDVFITVSPSDKHLVQTLVSAQPQGAMKGILSGSVDLGKALKAATSFPGSPLAGLPDDMKKQLGDVLNGQMITIGTSADGDTGTVDATVSKGLLENVPKLIGVLTGQAKPPAPDAK